MHKISFVPTKVLKDKGIWNSFQLLKKIKTFLAEKGLWPLSFRIEQVFQVQSSWSD